MDSKTKTGVIIAICVVGVVLIMGIAATAFVLSTRDTEDTSMVHALDKAMENQGNISVGGWNNIKLNDWVSYSSYSSNYHWAKYKAHYNNGSLVLEIMYSSNLGTNKPIKDEKITQVHYYSAADIGSITYTENGVTYTWHG